jgi:alpha-tubulin suppressor-like RCC1 family protein
MYPFLSLRRAFWHLSYARSVPLPIVAERRDWFFLLAGLLLCSPVGAVFGQEPTPGEVVVWGTANFAEPPEPIFDAVDVAAGIWQGYLALRADGTVLGWGGGVGAVPEGLANVEAISAGGGHALALLNDGTVVAWGSNTYNQAAPPPGLSDVTAIAAGGDHSLALLANGTVIAWGGNWAGQASPPSGLSDVVSIAVGLDHSLALRADGTVALWGSNVVGQTEPPIPLENVIAIAAAETFSVALLSDGTVVAWGALRSGIPAVASFPGAYDIVAGELALVVKMSGGFLHRLGARESLPPALVGVHRLSMGWDRGIALLGQAQDRFPISLSATEGGSVTVVPARDLYFSEEPVRLVATADAGHTFMGWIGDVSGIQKSVYATLTPGFSVMAHFRNLLAPGDVVAWGDNRDGKTLPPEGLTDAVALAAGHNHSLALRADGTVIGWGTNSQGQTSVPAGLTGVMAIAAGNSFSLALREDGTVIGWREDRRGYVSPPAGLSTVVAIAAGRDHALALRADGTVVAWGSNSAGQATPPPGLSGVTAIAAGDRFSLALKEDGTVVGWGENRYGQSTPPSTLSDVIAIAAGSIHGLALLADGTVVGWGDWISYAHFFTDPPTDAIAVSAGSEYSMALLADGTVVTWGRRAELASGLEVPSGLSGVQSISAGATHALALRGAISLPLRPRILGPAAYFLLPAENEAPVVLDASESWGAIVAYHWTWTKPDGTSGSATGATLETYFPRGRNTVTLSVTDSQGETATVSRSVWVRSIGREPPTAGEVVLWGITNFAEPPNVIADAIDVAAGPSEGFVALRADGSVLGWGEGVGAVPEGLSGVISIHVSDGHGLALRGDGTVAVWGENAQALPAHPDDLENVVALAAGLEHGLALRGDGTVVGWGRNQHGQAVPPPGLSDVVAIAAGRHQSLALKADGSVIQWGTHGWGSSPPPSSLSNVIAIAAGSTFSAALQTDGTVRIWGGIFPYPFHTRANFPHAVDILAGPDVLVVVMEDGSIESFGWSEDLPPSLTGVARLQVGHQRGVAIVSEPQNTFPIPVLATAGGSVQMEPEKSLYLPDEVIRITAVAQPGFRFLGWPGNVSLELKSITQRVSPGFSVVAEFLGIDLTAELVAWGANGEGQALPPEGLTGVVAIAAGLEHSFAILADGSVAGWGNDRYEQLQFPSDLSDITAIAPSFRFNLALRGDGSVIGWGAEWSGEFLPPSDLPAAVAVAAGAEHCLVLLESGTVVAWGSDIYGQASVPPGLSDVEAIAAGSFHSLALRADGTVVGWGHNHSGQASVPAGLTGVVAISAGSSHSLALLEDGTVLGWGSNTDGRATAPAGLSDVVAIAAGSHHSLALRADGTVVGWGANDSGQTFPPEGLNGVTAIAAGGLHSVALRGGGAALPETPLDAFLAERLADFPASQRTWFADANGNGLANLVEYARGTDPGSMERSADWPVVGYAGEWAAGREVTLVLRTDDPALHIVAEMSTDLDAWTWLLMRGPSGSWEINVNLVELLDWNDLGEGMHEARLQALSESPFFFLRMQVDYLP